MGQLFTREAERPLVILTGFLDDGGKSKMLHVASNDRVSQEIPTIGMHYEVAELRANGIGLTVHCWDYGGCDKIAGLWRAQLKRAVAVLLVVDPCEIDPAYRAFYHRKKDVPPFSVQDAGGWPVYPHQILPHIFQQAGCRKPVLVLVRTNPQANAEAEVAVDASPAPPPGAPLDLGAVAAALHLGPEWDGGTRDTDTSGSLGAGAPWRVQEAQGGAEGRYGAARSQCLFIAWLMVAGRPRRGHCVPTYSRTSAVCGKL